MDNVYEAPESELEQNIPDSKVTGREIAILGLLLFYGPFFGVAGVIAILVSSFRNISGNVTVDIRVADSIWMIALGFFVGLVGVFLMLVALLQKHNREPWFFWCTVSASVLWCTLLFPIGCFVGALILGIFLFRRKEFLDPEIKMKGGIEFIPQLEELDQVPVELPRE